MKHKRLNLSALLLLGLGLTGLQAQTMYIRESSGTQTVYDLSSVRKMTFSGGNVNIHKTDNSTGVYALNELRYLNFTNLTTSVTEKPLQLGNAKLIAYPNPVADVLTIDLRNLTSEGTISIITLEGIVMLTRNTSGNSLVSISLMHLPKGIYLCRYTTTEEIKTVKIIKQ